MEKNQAIAQINALLSEAENVNDWGGGEDKGGALHPGKVEWKTLQDKIAAIVGQIDTARSEDMRSVLVCTRDMLAREYPSSDPIFKRIARVLK